MPCLLNSQAFISKRMYPGTYTWEASSTPDWIYMTSSWTLMYNEMILLGRLYGRKEFILYTAVIKAISGCKVDCGSFRACLLILWNSLNSLCSLSSNPGGLVFSPTEYERSDTRWLQGWVIKHSTASPLLVQILALGALRTMKGLWVV